MAEQNWDWLDKQEELNKEKGGNYFSIQEGSNKFVLLSHIAPLAQVWDGSKYRVATEGDTNVSIKGVCWVLQREDDQMVIKQAKLPYIIIKAIRGYSEDGDWDFGIPFLHPLNLIAKNAGEKSVEYTLQASPKAIEIPKEVLDELATKPTPEEIVEKLKGGDVSQGKTDDSPSAVPPYPDEELSPDDIPF